MNKPSGGPAAFLDRDGVINVDHGYVHRVADFEFVPGVLDACRQLRTAGYRLIVVTNQAGIAYGYYDESAFATITEWMKLRFIEAGAPLTAVYYCPHHPAGKVAQFTRQCACRKPEPGMILQAIRDHQIDVTRSLLVGDKQSDLAAAAGAGIARRYLIRHAAPDAHPTGGPREFRSLGEVVQAVLAEDKAATAV